MTFRSQAIVLRTISWPRQARFFVLFTKDHGKVKGMAAGAEKIQSKVAGHLQPFVISEVMFARGRSVDRIAQARLEKRYSSFAGNYQLFMLGSYVLEVVEKLTREYVADEHVWNELLAVLDELNEQGEWGDADRFALLVRMFALRMLDRMGYRPELYVCVRCRQPLQPGSLAFSVLQGGVFCSSCAKTSQDVQPMSDDCLKLLRAIIKLPVANAMRILTSPNDARLAVLLIDQLVSMQLQAPLHTTRLLAVQTPSFSL